MLSSTNSSIYDVSIFINKLIFLHLKLEIASAIPAINDDKWKQNNSVAQGLNIKVMIRLRDLVKACVWLDIAQPPDKIEQSN